MSAAVVLMAYGSPDRLEDVPAYYEDIRGGRPTAPERLAELVERYRLLGVEERNPLNEITELTRAGLERELGIPVHTGMRHWRPRIADAAERALAGGARTIVGLVLAPHYSTMSIGAYRRQLEEAVGERADLLFVERWGSEPAYLELIVERLRGTSAHVVFTAHSLPARILEERDPYVEELLESSRLVAEEADLGEWSFAFQSASPTGERWLGPDILEHLEELAPRDVLVCPIGFVSDHLEVRWDLDVEAQEKARRLGMRFARMEMPNEAIVPVLRRLVEQHVPALR
jgi:protoporphyrin/coproporphyrin ferrochelatase